MTGGLWAIYFRACMRLISVCVGRKVFYWVLNSFTHLWQIRKRWRGSSHWNNEIGQTSFRGINRRSDRFNNDPLTRAFITRQTTTNYSRGWLHRALTSLNFPTHFRFIAPVYNPSKICLLAIRSLTPGIDHYITSGLVRRQVLNLARPFRNSLRHGHVIHIILDIETSEHDILGCSFSRWCNCERKLLQRV